MKNKRILYLLAAILIATAMSCNLLSSLSKGDSASSDPDLGEVYRSEYGGFEFQPLVDYTLDDTMGILSMTAPDGNMQSGPGMMLIGGMNYEEISLEKAIKNMMDQTPDYEYGNIDAVEIDGVEGAQVDFEGEYEGEDVQGQIIIVMVDDLQQFICVMLAPPDQWDDEYKRYEKVLDTIRFFEADPDALSLDTGMEEAEEDAMPTEQPAAEPQAAMGEIIRQWAVDATASDEYGSDAWSARQAIGEPDVVNCGDDVAAWASESATSYSWIELTYDVPVVPTEVTVVQNYNPSQVVEVDVITTAGEEYIIWTGEPEKIDYCPDEMTITLDLGLDEQIVVNKVRVYVDQSVGWGWNEIDAVELVGKTAGEGSNTSTQTQNQNYTAPETFGDFSFGLSGCEETTISGTEGYIWQPEPSYYQMVLSFEGGAVNITLPLDYAEQTDMELLAYEPWSTDTPMASVVFYDQETYYAADDGSIWYDYADANHITGMLDFNATQRNTMSGAVNSSCTVGVWVAFNGVEVLK